MARPAAAALAATLAALALTACGGSGPAAPRGDGRVYDVYSSLPLHGPDAGHAREIARGIRMALDDAGDQVGGVPVVYRPLDDAPGGGASDTGQAARDAVQAIEDDQTILYIGDFGSAATAVSIPTLNQIGIPQIGPASTYAGLTDGGAGAGPGEPQKYYPAGRRTFVRVVPDDTVQAGALVRLMREGRCRAVAVADDGGPFTQPLARLVQDAAAAGGLAVVDALSLDPHALGYAAVARALRRARADCVLYAGDAGPTARAFLRDVGAVLPRARLYASNGVCDTGLPAATPDTAPLPRRVARRLLCTAPVLAVRAYPGGAAFAPGYRRRFGRDPSDGYALVGYEAMSLGLDAIRSLVNGVSRDALASALFKAHDRASPLGAYSITPNGDTTLDRYGVYRLGPRGGPVYVRAITPG